MAADPVPIRPLVEGHYRLGERLGAGESGEVHPISGDGIPPGAVVKEYFTGALTPAEQAPYVRQMFERHVFMHQLFPHNAVEPYFVVQFPDGGFGLVMQKLEMNELPTFKTPRTVEDLKEIREKLLKVGFYQGDGPQWGLGPNGEILLYDFDGYDLGASPDRVREGLKPMEQALDRLPLMTPAPCRGLAGLSDSGGAAHLGIGGP